jgi:hypothetical protein
MQVIQVQTSTASYIILSQELCNSRGKQQMREYLMDDSIDIPHNILHVYTDIFLMVVLCCHYQAHSIEW